MLKLKLDHIKKTYKSGEVVTALKEISIGFRKNELVSILVRQAVVKRHFLILLAV